MNRDSARWCAVCERHGDHHTDRHPCEACAGRGGSETEPLNPWGAELCDDCKGTGYATEVTA